MRHLVSYGAYVVILDLASPPSEGLSHDKTRFFKTDVANTEQVAQAVERSVGWTRETGAVLGGVVAAAGIPTVGKVRAMSQAA